MVDATIDGGDLASAILDVIGPTGLLVGIDRDPKALDHARRRLAGDPRVRLVHCDFGRLASGPLDLAMGSVEAVVFDLGLSSLQLDDPQRGFSFRFDGPLDMRFDQTRGVTAAELVNQLSEEHLAGLIRTWGEERWAAAIARALVRRRHSRPVVSSAELAEIVSGAIPRSAWPRRIHPATKTFQALRMEVNQEIDSLRSGLGSAIQLLSSGGRLAVIAFHSIEDRVVKDFMRTESKDCLCPPGQPICTCRHRASLRRLGRRPLVAGLEEVSVNPRSRSARLRLAERI